MKIPFWVYIAAFVLGFILLIATDMCQLPHATPTTTQQSK